MEFEVADWRDLTGIVKETHRLWGAGLDRQELRELLDLQLNHPWARRHYDYLVAKQKDCVLSSLKRYRLQAVLNNCPFSVAGIGAVFTPERMRGNGYAQALIRHVIAEARRDGDDAVMLFSDIGPAFYEELEFEPLGALDFLIDELKDFSSELFQFDGKTLEYWSRPLARADVCDLSAAHRRWLRRQTFGLVRDELYLSFKLVKEQFMAGNSRLGWPGLQLIGLPDLALKDGYALVERGRDTLRVLEVVADETRLGRLWRAVIQLAFDGNLNRVRGWESLTKPFYPGFSYLAIMPETLRKTLSLRRSAHRFSCYEREWGQPMFLPLSDRSAQILDLFPCPFLELDHF